MGFFFPTAFYKLCYPKTTTQKEAIT